MIPPAWQLATFGILFVALFGVWKATLAPRLARLVDASSA